MDQHYEALWRLAAETGIKQQEWTPFIQGTIIRQIQAGQQLITAGEPVEAAYFCMSGLFRLYYILEDGREYNVGFTLEGDYATSHAAMIRRMPSAYTIEALEDSVVIEMDHVLLETLMAEYHSWERFVRLAVERLYIRKEERERELLYLSAAERYQSCLRKYPGLEQRIPQYHIASYIGISPVSLSRMLHRGEIQ